jgi:hypothetical protein
MQELANWLIKIIRNISMFMMVKLSSKGTFLLGSRYRGQFFFNYSGEDKNALVGMIILLIKHMLKWDKFTPRDRTIAKKMILQELRVQEAKRKKKKSNEILAGYNTAICLNGKMIPHVKSFHFDVSHDDSLTKGQIVYYNGDTYKEEIEKYGTAVEHVANVYIESVRKKGMMTIFDVLINLSPEAAQHKEVHAYLKKFYE